MGTAYAIESAEQTPEEQWFYDDDELDIDDVNEGELTFVLPVNDKNILHSGSVLVITEKSLKTGWVDLQQCYRDLDSIDKTEIVYRYKNIKQLQIISSGNIGNAKVDGQAIQLEDIGSSAHICVQAKVQILEKIEQDTFTLSNGPYYRRFLDGFYPYHVTLSISYPVNKLKYSHISPAPQPLFDVIQQPGKLLVDTWFEGALLINITFSSTYINQKNDPIEKSYFLPPPPA